MNSLVAIKMEIDSTNESEANKSRKEHSNDQPLFLRKAYAMINSCPADLGGWSAKGDSFIINNTEDFANKVIPTFYRHNNWSSFVRQLNFYGFRKVRSESYLHAADTIIWEFMHPLFVRGKPELLAEIKKVAPTTGMFKCIC